MLQLYDLNKTKIKGLKQYKDYCIESVLDTGDKTLSFLYPSRLCKEVIEESYIRTKKDEFVVKEITGSGEWKSIKARLNVDELEGQPWEHFDTTEKTITECLTLALAGTGWTVGTCNVTKRRTVRKTNCSSWEIIQEAKKVYMAEMQFDTLNKKINIADKLGSDKGVYFMDSLNLKTLDIQSNSYDFYTRLIAIGKDGLKATVENFQYSNKKKTFIWKDERYTDIASLTEDAILKLNELSKPYRSYGADIIDLANISDKYSILSYGLGDTISLVSKDKGIKEKQRIVKITEYPEEPHRNSCEIANGILSFADVQKEFQDTSDTVNNITTDNGTVDGSSINGIKTEQIYDFEASVASITNITVVNARINALYAEKADIGSLNAVTIRVGTLEATTAKITDLTAINANIVNLQANKASIVELNAVSAKVNVLEVDTASIKNLLAGNLTSENIQSLILTSGKVTVENGFIKNAMIDSLDVNKINAGDISANKFRIKSDSGNLLIFDNTIQIKDSVRTRVQIGKDAANDYNMYVWDNTGKLMFDATGLKADGIKNKIIRDDMVSDTANISGGKLNISSVVTSINNGTTTLNSSKVLLDGTGQTLNVAFNKLDTKVDSAPPNIVTDQNITKLDGAIDGMLKINSIKGRTLQNLFKPSTTILGSDSGGYWYYTNIHPIVDLSSKTVTLINPTQRVIVFGIRDLNNIAITDITVLAMSTKVVTLEANRKSFAISGLKSSGWTDANKTELKGMILEGDYTNKPMPPYFEDIRSVGETGENLEVVSCGKNLFDGTMLFGSVFIENGTVATNSLRMSTNLIRIKPNTNYKLTGYGNYTLSWITFYDSNKIYLGQVLNYGYKAGNTVLLTPNNAYYCRQCFQSSTNIIQSDLDYISNNFQLEYGTTTTTYELYKEHRQPIALSEPLRGLPNGVCDTVDTDRGKVIRRIGKVVLDGSEKWVKNGGYSNDTITSYWLSGYSMPNSNYVDYRNNENNLICNKLNVMNLVASIIPPVNSLNVAQMGVGSSNWLLITSSIMNNIEGFKAWLQSNKTTVYYELETPIEEDIEIEQYMKQFKDGYFITEGSLINPTVDLTYSTSIASAASMLKEVTTSNTTTLNIQQGKIDSLISNTTITKDGQNIQLKDAYNSTVATVNSINSTIGSHTSTINALTGQITGIDTRVNDVKRDLDGTVATVNAHTTSINGLNSTVSTQGSSISQLLNQISLKVSQTDVNKTLLNIPNSISGQNLIPLSEIFWEQGTILSADGSNGVSNKRIRTIDKIRIKPNTEYVLVGANQNLQFIIFQYKSDGTYISSINWISIDKQRITTSTDAAYIRLIIRYDDTTVISPSEINTISVSFEENFQDKITTVSERVSLIDINLDGITNRVGSVEQTTTTIDGKVVAMDARLKAAEIKITDNAIISTVSTTINTAKDEAIEIAKAISEGNMLYTDPTFTNGTNGINVYNNSGGAGVALTRIAKPSDCPTTSTHCIEVKVINTTTSPGIGGFFFGNETRANAVFVLKMIAKIPVGSNLTFASNGYGTGGYAKWLTSNAGTGKWEEYVHKVTCGDSGTFSTTNFFYIDKGTIPFSWLIASATIYDITDIIDITGLNRRIDSAETSIIQTANDITLKVSKTDYTGNAIATMINQSATTIKIVASKLNLTGYITATNLSTAGQTTINGGNIATNTLNVDRLNSNNANPILRLFGGCSLDATLNNEVGVGTAVRLKWNDANYIRIASDVIDIYQAGIAKYRFYPTYFDCKPATIYLADQCKLDASGGTLRLYISKSADTGIRVSSDGTVTFLVSGTPKHIFYPGGTKAGGTIVVDGATLGMSPIDSPQTLLESVLFNIDVLESGSTVPLDSTFLRTISTYAVFCSNPGVIIVSKDRTSFTVRGYTGKVDFRVIGYRIGYEEQYYQVVG